MQQDIEFIRDSAASAAAVVSRLYGQSLDAAQLRADFETQGASLTPRRLVEVMEDVGFSCLRQHKTVRTFARLALPAILVLNNGGYAVLAKVSEERALVQMPGEDNATAWSLDELGKLVSGEVIIIRRTPQGEEPLAFGFSWLWRELTHYRSIFRETLVASAFIQIFALATPIVFMLVIDKVLSHNSMSTLAVLLFALATVSIFDVVLSGLRAYLMSHTTSRIDLDLSIRTFRRLLNLPLSYFESRRVGDTVARMRELESVRQFITGPGLSFMLDMLFVFIFLGVMFLFSPFLTMIVLIALPLFFLVSFVITPLLKGKLDDKYRLGAENQAFLVETLGGMETVKGSTAEAQLREKWEQQMVSYSQAAFAGGTLGTLTNQTISLLSKLLVLLLLGFGANLVLAGDMTVGQLIAFNMLSGRVTAPVLRMAQIWQEFQSARVSTERIADILDTQPETSHRAGRTHRHKIIGNVEFKDVSFRYTEGSPEVLTNINFKVKGGELVGVVGSSGSGKTTLIKLLQRLYVPTRGKVLIDGIDIASTDSQWLRSQFGVVAQDAVLFDISVHDNIALGYPQATVDDVVEAAALAGASEFIDRLEQGYDTTIGERGGQLSAGQRQRIAIARALVKNPAILVFDEATSNLDYESEFMIRRNMARICEGRTVFMVTHRISSLVAADKIIVVEQGSIVEQDKPKKLEAANGRYAQLAELQQQGMQG